MKILFLVLSCFMLQHDLMAKGSSFVFQNHFLPIDTLQPIPDSIARMKVMDTVVIKTCKKFTKISCGGHKCIIIHQHDNSPGMENIQTAQKIYPNPARAGALVTIALQEDEFFPDLIEIYQTSGQLVQSVRQGFQDARVFNLYLPNQMKAGMYYVRMVDSRSKITAQSKILIQ